QTLIVVRHLYDADAELGEDLHIGEVAGDRLAVLEPQDHCQPPLCFSAPDILDAPGDVSATAGCLDLLMDTGNVLKGQRQIAMLEPHSRIVNRVDASRNCGI